MNSIADWAAVASALLAATALFYAARQQRTNVKEHFILWAMERLRQDDLRESRRRIYALSQEEIVEIVKLIRERKYNEKVDSIRKVCLAFDEIGYFAHKLGLVEFRDLLDMYPQTIKIWNTISSIIQAWREVEKDISFAYFEMLVCQKNFDVDRQFEKPTELHKS
jgi:hypothetical protein